MGREIKLTSEQISKMDEYRDKWLKIGLSTEPCDFEKSKQAVIECYKVAGLEPPKYFYLFDSPLSAAYAASLLKDTRLDNKVRDQVGAQVREQVREQVWEQVWDQVWEQVRDQVWDQVGAQVYGCHDANWLGFYDFFIRETSVTNVDKLNPLIELAKYCGWWAPYKNAVVFQNRPVSIKFDAAKLLHCENGPAIKYRDGFSVYSWHGVRVPGKWIEEKDTIDPSEIIRTKNVEQRAAGAAIIGWSRMLSVLKAKVIDDSGSSDVGQLIELTLPGLPKPGRFLKAECPRNGTIVEGVPYISDIDKLPINTAIAAQAWRIGDPQSEYIQPKRRT